MCDLFMALASFDFSFNFLIPFFAKRFWSHCRFVAFRSTFYIRLVFIFINISSKIHCIMNTTGSSNDVMPLDRFELFRQRFILFYYYRWGFSSSNKRVNFLFRCGIGADWNNECLNSSTTNCNADNTVIF